jgi:hypothetical protein
VGDSEEITGEGSSDHLEHGIWNMARSEMEKKKGISAVCGERTKYESLFG